MPDISELMHFAAGHHGLFHTEHARRCGVSEVVISAARRRGEIVRLGDGVYRFAVVPPTWHSDLLAACWMGGFRAAAGTP